MMKRGLLRSVFVSRSGTCCLRRASIVCTASYRLDSKPPTTCKWGGVTLAKRYRHDIASTYDFVQERNRWQSLLSKSDGDTHSNAGFIIPLAPTEWDNLVESLRSKESQGASDLADWLDTQQGVVTLPPSDASSITLLHDYFGTDDSTKKIILVRTKEDELATERLQSKSRILSPLADHLVKHGNSKEVYKVLLLKDSPLDREEAFMSYLLDSYSFERYKTDKGDKPETKKIEFPSSSARKETLAKVRSTYLVRDLITTPAMDLTPEALQRVAEQFVDGHDYMEVETVIGQDLLSYNGDVTDGHGCGMIYAVGAAATRPDHEPRLIQISYRPPQTNSHVALVGKGVTYDTGGLNLKPGSSMLNMKKDMGGAAHVLGLLSCLVEMEAPIAVDVWIPAVENVLGASSFRPGDILTSVTGQTTEIGNTDAEGRLILGDAVALASALYPDLIIDFATLTGAARVALGTDVVPFFANHSGLASQLLDAAVQERDPVWHLPLWHGYGERITKSSKVADLRNIPSDNGLGGAITAALYLQQFVGKTQDGNQIPWIHLDVYGMNAKSGLGEAQGLRAAFRFLCDQYSNGTT